MLKLFDYGSVSSRLFFSVLSYVRCNRFCISSFVVYALGISVGNLFPPLSGPLNLRAKFGFGGKSVLCLTT